MMMNKTGLSGKVTTSEMYIEEYCQSVETLLKSISEKSRSRKSSDTIDVEPLPDDFPEDLL